MDPRTIKREMTATWEAWACGDIDEFDAGLLDGGIKKTRKRKMSKDEIQPALRYARCDGLDIALSMVNDLRTQKRKGYDGHPPDPTKKNVNWSTVQAAVNAWGLCVIGDRHERQGTGMKCPCGQFLGCPPPPSLPFLLTKMSRRCDAPSPSRKTK